MALQKNMDLFQIKRFLEEEVKEQIFLEIEPILYIGQTVGGYFGATRQILCFLEFLGALNGGYNGKDKYSNGAKKIALPKKTIQFIEKLLGEIDPLYSQNGKYLYAMYRHGLVHLYQPRTIRQKNGRILKWAPYKGPRERSSINFRTDNGEFSIQDVRHLGIFADPSDKSSDFLTISITCLYKDLLTVIDNFYQKIKENKNDDLKRWRETTSAILEPEEYSVIEKEIK